MFRLGNIFNISFRFKKSKIFGRGSIIRHAHVCDFEREDEIVDNVIGKFMTIGINLPGTKNVLTETALEKLCAKIQNFDSNDEICAAVLHGLGGNFCCGIVQTNDSQQLSQTLLKTLHNVKKPVIGALEGHTIDFGFHLAAMCDLRMVDKLSLVGIKDKTFKLEIPPFLYQRLTSTLGLASAFEIVCSRQIWAAQHCLENGFANVVTDIGSSFGTALNYAQNITFHNSLESIIEHKSKLLSVLKCNT